MSCNRRRKKQNNVRESSPHAAFDWIFPHGRKWSYFLLVVNESETETPALVLWSFPHKGKGPRCSSLLRRPLSPLCYPGAVSRWQRSSINGLRRELIHGHGSVAAVKKSEMPGSRRSTPPHLRHKTARPVAVPKRSVEKLRGGECICRTRGG